MELSPICRIDSNINMPVDINDVYLKSATACPNSNFQFRGLVTSHSVKYLGKLQSNDEDVETRDEWWHEIRQSLRSTAMQLHGNSVDGYRESESIRRDICIISVYGTATLTGLLTKHTPCSPV